MSRLRYFVSILFDRPSSRAMSRFESAVLAVLWPAAVGFLGLALSEVIREQILLRSSQPYSAAAQGSVMVNALKWISHPWLIHLPQVSQTVFRTPMLDD